MRNITALWIRICRIFSCGGDRTQMSKTITDVKHFAIGGRESLEIAKSRLTWNFRSVHTETINKKVLKYPTCAMSCSKFNICINSRSPRCLFSHNIPNCRWCSWTFKKSSMTCDEASENSGESRSSPASKGFCRASRSCLLSAETASYDASISFFTFPSCIKIWLSSSISVRFE